MSKDRKRCLSDLTFILTDLSHGYYYFHCYTLLEKRRQKLTQIDERMRTIFDTDMSKDRRYRHRKAGKANYIYLRHELMIAILRSECKETDEKRLEQRFSDIRKEPLEIRLMDGEITLKLHKTVDNGLTVHFTKDCYRELKAKFMELLEKRQIEQLKYWFNALNGIPSYAGINEHKRMLLKHIHYGNILYKEVYMKIINSTFQIMGTISPSEIMHNIESFGRVCYKSEAAITDDSADSFIRKIIKSGHESVIEHEKVTVRIICDRGVTHEIARHRIASYSQESTRYCNYSQDKFGNELTFIKPCFWDEGSKAYSLWLKQMEMIEETYLAMISEGVAPEQARSVLPNSLKTEIVMTMNLREWRHFFKLRTSKRAHPQMREVSIPLFREMCNLLPAIFDDITIDE